MAHAPTPPQIKYSALDALLALMHARAPWDVRTLEAQPSLEQVRAAIREADTHGRNAAAYFLHENAFTPRHFASALLVGGAAARYEYVPSVLARAWAGRELKRAFEGVPSTALLECGVGGLLFMRTCLPGRLSTVLNSAANYVARVGPRRLEPAFVEELLAIDTSDVERSSDEGWQPRAILTFALDAAAGRRLLTEPHSHAPLLGLPEGAAMLVNRLGYAALAGAFASRDLDTYRLVFSSLAGEAALVTNIWRARWFLHQVPPEVARFLLEQPRPLLEALLAAPAFRQTLARDGTLAEALAASTEPRRNELRAALFYYPYSELLKPHWSACAPGVRSTWWATAARRWPSSALEDFIALVHELEPEPALDALMDAGLYRCTHHIHNTRHATLVIEPGRFPRLYLAYGLHMAERSEGERPLHPATLAAARARFACVTDRQHRIEVLSRMLLSRTSLHLFIDERCTFSAQHVERLALSAELQAVARARVQDLDALELIARLHRHAYAVFTHSALTAALAKALSNADQRALCDSLLERLERDDANYVLVLAAPFIRPLDGREPPTLAACHEIIRRGIKHGARAAARAAKSLVRTQLVGTRKRGAPS